MPRGQYPRKRKKNQNEDLDLGTYAYDDSGNKVNATASPPVPEIMKAVENREVEVRRTLVFQRVFNVYSDGKIETVENNYPNQRQTVWP